MAANNTFFAVCWQTAGGGSCGVVPHTTTGKLPQQGFPLITGHKAAVLDIEFSPFNDYLLATASEDCYVKLWNIPEGGLTENMTEPVQTLQGHRRKVGQVRFNPVANNVLATSSQDYTVKLWDVETGQVQLSLDGYALRRCASNERFTHLCSRADRPISFSRWRGTTTDRVLPPRAKTKRFASPTRARVNSK